ncbi:Cullin-associated and neddylation-dissociated 1 [Capsaspora owczarzaki ATCC 30864]|uniref:Cullin-associated and neddylation-dissociated 1 n=1 Tax=Capsaspora owczarzaki (strain ATCC 30864) TaxID=595528 RepID=A0A0D2X4F8_CAPO3|nr:Cullin-associated and neddylation-dissociated 1 [Capsaspora owczarzaki ATCC 30864]KJE95984.1 Cullin-associated and neddylation-dissociated 1 [Capsaspora owczarzaki ATCC 30864]|eukprot:XP_004345111.2 Cullin-associated and neddylation-dissociated 1 [Capsaspora owczarzaki ATCC 30864]
MASISSLLEKMTSNDNDFRFMACNDLMTELNKPEFKLDADTEGRIVTMLLKLVDDKNGEVQNLVVKCLAPLSRKIRDNRIEEICDRLCSNILSEKEQLRDISSIGLKNVVSEIAPGCQVGQTVSKNLVTRLLKAVSKDELGVQQPALEILADMLDRFGLQLAPLHSTIHEALVPLLSSPKVAVRKRAIVAIGFLVPVVPEAQFTGLMQNLTTRLDTPKPTADTKTVIQCLATISRHAGSRLDNRLGQIVPRIVSFCAVQDDELREYCFQALESFVFRCPKEISADLSKAVALCLKFIEYDPNYNYDDDEDSMDTRGDDDDEGGSDDGGDDDDDAFSDDEDMSWKVRRSAAKCLAAIVSTRPDLLDDFYATVTPALIARFKEREATVQIELFQVYLAVLRNTRIAVSASTSAGASFGGAAPMHTGDDSAADTPIAATFRREVPSLVRALQKQLKGKDIRARQGCMSILKEAASAILSAFSSTLPQLVPGIKLALTDKASTSNLKIETLQLLALIFSTHQPEYVQPVVSTLAPLLVTGIQDSFYKIVAESLAAATQLLRVLRASSASTSSSGASTSASDISALAASLFQVVFARLSSSVADQEVKERSITCIGHLIASFGDVLAQDTARALPVLAERLRNESTRLAAVRSFGRIAESSLTLPLNAVLSDVVREIAGFLRKNNRSLRVASLETLSAIVRVYAASVDASIYPSVLAELRPLISDADLHVAQLAVTVASAIVTAFPGSVAAVSEQGVLEAVLQLLRSSMLQGGALDATLVFFRTIVAGDSGLNYRTIIETLIRPIYMENVATVPTGAPSTPHQAFYSISKCVGGVCLARPAEHIAIVSQFAADVENPGTVDNIKLLALLCIGEIGKFLDLSSLPSLSALIITQFGASSEEVKTAASYALGCMSVGNLSQYLPFILAQIDAQPKRQYLLLHSLKEIISCISLNPESVTLITPFVSQIWSLLMAHSARVEEGTRNVVAECLGKLTVIDPATCFPELEARIADPSAFTRATVVAAVKHTIADTTHSIDSFLLAHVARFLQMIQDPDSTVRRVALVAFNSSAHNKPFLVRDLLGALLPALYTETRPRPELIRIVEMGPFKHTVDDGLDIRKAAYECMYTLLDTCLDRIDLYEFLGHVMGGLKDHTDIKTLCHLILMRLTVYSPTVVLQRLDELIEPLRATITTPVKVNAVKQEVEKNDEIVRSALRAVAAILRIPDAAATGKFGAFIAELNADAATRAKLDAVVKDDQKLGPLDAMDTSA